MDEISQDISQFPRKSVALLSDMKKKDDKTKRTRSVTENCETDLVLAALFVLRASVTIYGAEGT